MATRSEEEIEDLVNDAIRDHRNLKKVTSLLYDAEMRNRLRGALALGR